MWVCAKCRAEAQDHFKFCTKCGQSKETNEVQEQQPEQTTAISGPGTSPAAAEEEIVQPVRLVAEPVLESPAPPAYAPSVFASQFPSWNLLPTDMGVRRLKRTT
jgi:hypothetical protein